MHRANKSQPLGIACLFVSLAILPFSLKAAGFDLGLSLSAATDVFRQMSGVIGTGYDSAPDALWASAQPLSVTEVAQELGSCGDVGCPEISACNANDSANPIAPSVCPSEKAVDSPCRQACRKVNLARVAMLPKRVRVKVELPLRDRVVGQERIVGEVFQLRALSYFPWPAVVSRVNGYSIPCGKARKDLIEAAESIASRKQQSFMFKFSAPTPAVTQFKAPRPAPTRPPNHAA